MCVFDGYAVYLILSANHGLAHKENLVSKIAAKGRATEPWVGIKSKAEDGYTNYYDYVFQNKII